MKFFVKVVWAAFFCGFAALAQFSSGSTGSDGALDYTNKCPGGSVTFNPAAFTPPLDPAHDNIFNFTTITVPSGCVVIFSSAITNSPIIWLATGNVNISGGLNLNGTNGGATFPTSQRVSANPGPGGYPGGVGSNGTNPAGAGFGPGGGTVTNNQGASGKYTGNQFAIPLVGGSGGGGASNGSGGAGGGAILIASSTQIAASNGYIYAYGGSGSGCGGGGAGGAVRLVAPAISAGTINVQGGNSGCTTGATGGAIRIESFNNPNCGGCNVGGGNSAAGGTLTFGSPYNTFVSSSVVPTIQVTSVNGITVASPSTGSFQVPDVVINTGSAVTIQIQGGQIPIGTTATLTFYSDNGPDMTITSTPFAGTLAASTATAQFTFPPGYTRGYVYATFTP